MSLQGLVVFLFLDVIAVGYGFLLFWLMEFSKAPQGMGRDGGDA